MEKLDYIIEKWDDKNDIVLIGENRHEFLWELLNRLTQDQLNKIEINYDQHSEKITIIKHKIQ